MTGPCVDILITNGRVVRLCGSAAHVERGAVAISHGRIAGFIAQGSESHPPASVVLDAKGGIVLPGLVNAHTHSPENLARGRAERLAFDDWMTAVWTRLDSLTPDLSRLAALVGAAEMIRTGVTGVVDHLRRFPMTDATLNAVIGAYAEAGMTACVPVMLRDAVDAAGRSLDSAHLGPLPSPDQQISIIRNAVSEAARRGIRLALGPSAPHRCSDEMLDAIGAAVERDGSALHTHVDENPSIAETSRRRFGHSTIEELDRRGLLGPHTALAHCVAITQEDRQRIARSGAVVVHNPLANMRLASGTCDVPSLKDAGAAITFGTDGAASNDGQNLWESVKLATLLTRRPGSDPATWLEAGNALKMATANGDLALRGAVDQPADGELHVGAPADIAVFAADTLPCADADLAARLVLGSTARSARHVIAGGRILLRDGHLTTIDEEKLSSEIGQHARELAL